MSRVEDDRNEARIAQQRAIQKQQEEAKKVDRQAGESAFARKLAGTPQGATPRAPQTGYESLLDAMPESTQTQQKESLGRSVLKQATSAFQEKLQQSRSGENEKLGESRLASAETEQQSSAGRSEDAKGAKETAENRETEQKKTEEGLEKGAARSGRGGALKTGADGGGGKGSGGGDSNPGDGGMGPGFRFNPALMAPVPVAQARDNSASERLRKVFQEIAQKIVEHVRVGTNAAGKSEFQIDLRSNVLSGLSIKLSSGGNGKISASFSGSDREVLKLLEENKEGLQKALGSRGLTLESLKIEVRA